MTITPVTSGTDLDKSQIVARSLKTSETKVLVVNGSDGRYVPTGHIVHVNGGIVFAVPFNVRRPSVSGGPVPVVEGVRRGVGFGGGAALFAFSNSGTLAFVPGPLSTSSNRRDIILADRAGAIERVKVPSGPYYHPRFSPGRQTSAFGIDDGKDVSIWIFDLSSSSSMRRLTFGGKDRYPTWSPGRPGYRVPVRSRRRRNLPPARGTAPGRSSG